MEDAFFKVPSKHKRLKTEPTDREGVEKIEDLLEKSQFLVYENPQHLLLGCIRVETVKPQLGSFGMLSVPMPYANKGIGKLLVLEAEKWLSSKNCKRVEISVVNIRENVIQFYEKLGYRSFGDSIDFDEYCGETFLLKKYKGIVKFITMGKDLPGNFESSL